MTNPSDTRDSELPSDLRRFAAHANPPLMPDERAMLNRAADTIDRLTSSGEAPVYRVDWENAPRDGTWVLLLSKGTHADYRIEQRLFWSKHYSIHGLGGCWSDGFVTMSDLDFIGWRFDASPREGHVEVPVERGWVLERADSSPAEPWYWAAGQIDPTRSSAWTQNHMAAIRFARRDDAEAVSYRLMRKAKIDVRVCAHEWSAALPHNQGETK